jgi:ABC-type oligopeptide transport system ATPase subunit
VRYALTRPVRLHQHLKGHDAIEAELERLVERVRLTPAQQFLAKYPHELSGGQRQRVAIARALAAQPRVLLADEPVSMLDVSIRLEVLDLLDELRSQFQLAVLYVTHDIASARYFADDTLVMYAGEIVERGPSEDVTQQPAHPYTQLLVASAPDPDNLAEQDQACVFRRGAARRQCAIDDGRLPVRAALPPGRRSLPCAGAATVAGERAASRSLLATRCRRTRLASPDARGEGGAIKT